MILPGLGVGMIADFTALDLVALGWFVLLWLGYANLVDRPLWGRPNLNRAMRARRVDWMREMARRENRMPDVVLIGHLMQSVAFFASATMIVVAALLGALGAVDQIRGAVEGLHFAAPAARAAWQAKILIMVALFVYSFFKFSWSLRQWNYCCVLIGGTPPAPLPDTEREAVAERLGAVASGAAVNFNGGLRAYYFALAMLAWFVNPWAFMAASLLVLAVLARRQFFSESARAIAPPA